MTNKQSLFIEEYLKDFNATQAAIRAGYSPKTARQIGKNLLTKIYISEAIKERINEKALSADETLQRLADIARGDMGDFIEIDSGNIRINLKKAEEKKVLHLIKKIRVHTVSSTSNDGIEKTTQIVEIELYNQLDALIQLGKRHKLFTDKQEVSGPNGGAIPIETFQVIVDKVYGEGITATDNSVPA